MRSIALTGGIASGKSAVADEFARLGAVVIDADVLAREVVEPGTRGLERIRERFGDEVIGADGRLDRARLGGIVFADAAARKDLEAITHPAIRARAAELSLAAPPGAVVIQVIPLLTEVGRAGEFDVVIVVDVAEETQLARLMRRDGHSPEQALARLRAQASRAQRLEIADEVIANDGTREELTARVRDVWRHLRADADEPRRRPRGG